MNFRVGQKVVCVDDTYSTIGGSPSLLKYGAVYTVAAVGLYGGKHPHIDLREVPAPVPLAWEPRRFRPAVENKTDISIFTKILDDASRKVPVDAVR